MLFTLKKVLGGMMLPLPLLLLLIALGIALLWFSRFQRTGKLCVSLGWLLLLLLSLQPVADSLLKPIEDKYPTWRGEKRVQYVVVLGGGYTWNPDWAPSSNLINNSLPRLTEGSACGMKIRARNSSLPAQRQKQIRSVRQKPGPEWQRAWAYRAAKSLSWINPKIPKRKPLR